MNSIHKFILLLTILFSMNLLAGDVFWNNAAGGNWNDGANWDTGNVPQSGDDVFITLDGTYTVTLDVNPSINSLTIGAASGVQTLAAGSRTFNITSLTTINSNGILRIDNSNTINSDINNSGIFRVRGTNNTMSGALTNTSVGLVEFDATVNHSSLTLNGSDALNEGTWRMKNEVSNARTSQLIINNGVKLTNAVGGTIDSEGTLGSRGFLGTVDNQGTINVNYSMTLGSGGATSVNTGDINVATGMRLTVSGGFTFNSGTMAGDGEVLFSSSTATFNIATLPSINLRFASSTFNAASTVTSNGNITIDNSNVINASIDNNGTFRVRGTNNTMSGALTNNSGGLVEFDATVNHSSLTLNSSDALNEGTWRMKNEVSNARTSQLIINNGVKLTNAATGIITSEGNLGSRGILGSVDNQGTINVDYSMTIGAGGAASVNTGDINVATGMRLTVSGGFTFNGGTMAGDGEVLFSSSNATFNVATIPSVNIRLASTTLNAAATVTSNGNLTFDNSNVINASIDNNGTFRVRGTNNTMSGALANASGGLVEFDATVNHSSLTLNGSDALNEGTWRMKNEVSNARTSQLVINNGVKLTNAATGIIASEGNLGSRGILGSVDNQGTINVDYSMTIGAGGATSVNTGDINVATGMRLTVSGGFTFDSGTMAGDGEALFSSSTATFNVNTFPALNLRFSATTLNAAGTITSNGNLTFDNSNAINASIDNNGTFRVRGTGNTMSGALTNTSSGLVEFDATVNHSSLTLNGSDALNEGTWRMKNEVSNARTSQLVINNGVKLTNAATGIIASEGTLGSRGILGSVDNQGTINVDYSMTLGSGGATSVNTGDINVATGMRLTVSGGFTFDSGTMAGDGEALFSSSTATFNVNTFPALNLRFSATTLNAAGTITSNGNLTFDNSNAINASIDNNGTFRVRGTGNVMSGALTNTSSGLVEFDATVNNSVLTLNTNDALNEGTWRMKNEVSNGRTSQLSISNGVKLTNAASGIIVSDGTVGSRGILGSVDNQGTINVNYSMTLGSGGATSVNTGDINVATGMRLTVSGGFTFDSGTMAGDGEALFSSSTATFNVNTFPALNLRFSGTTLNAAGTITSNGNLTFDNSNAINASIDNNGTFRVRGTGNVMSGALTNTSSGLVEFDATVNNSVLTLNTNDALNEGIWRMKNEVSNGRTSQLSISNGVKLTNAAGGTIVSDGTVGSRGFLGSVDNQGTINVNYSMTLGAGGATSVNTGDINVATGMRLTVSGGFTFDSGTMAGDGEALFSSSTATFNTASFPTLSLRFSATTLNAASTITSDNNLIIDNSNTINAPINNNGLLRVRGTGNNMFGALTTTAASQIILDAVINNSVIAFAQGFTNNGYIELGNVISNGRTCNIAFNAGETLTNAGGATIHSKGTVGSRQINGSFSNNGTLILDHPMTINGTNVTNAASGTIEGTTTLAVLSSTLQNAGTVKPAADGKGTLNLNGNYTQPSTGALAVDLEGLTAGTDFDQLNISGQATLDGALNISLLNNYQPDFGDEFIIMNYASNVDTFTTITGQDIGNGYYLNTDYRNGQLVLVAGNPPTVPTYTITASAGNNGAISPSGDVDVDEGMNQTFTFTPDPGYEVADVEIDGNSVGASADYTFTNVMANATIHVTFQPQTFTIVASAGNNGSISPDGNVSVTGGNDQAFTITPDPGYHVLNVNVNGDDLGPLTNYTFTNVTSNHTITATFEINTYTIVALAGNGGTISPSGNVAVTHGNDAGFTITPNAGFEIASLFVDGNPVAITTVYEFFNVTTNHTIQANFQPITYTISASAGAGGVINPSGNIVVAEGSGQGFNIIPNAGYSIDDVLVDNVSVGAVSNYVFDNVDSDHTIVANFIQNTFSITAIAGPNGSIDPVGTFNVAGGSDQTFTITPDAGYSIADVKVNNISQGPLSSLTLNNVDDDYTVEATFVITTHIIFASSGANGSIDPSGQIVVNEGNDQGFTITPDVDYQIGDVIVDGVSQGAISTYEFFNVTTNHSIGVYFTPDNFEYNTLNTGTTEQLNSVYFVSNLVGYAVGTGGTILITLDGGQTWTPSNIDSNIDLHSVVVVDDTVWVSGTNGHICYSINGGQTWVSAGPTITQTFYSVSFISGGYGFAVGADGLIYYWNGTSWQLQLNAGNITFHSVFSISGVAYAVGSGGVIYYFNGTSWVPSGTLGGTLYGITFFNASFGYAVGTGGVIYRTIDGGANWVALNSGVSVVIRQIVIGDLNTAWAICDDGIILQTTDGGATWEVIDAGISGNFLGISFSGGQGYIVGSGGIAYNFESTIVGGDPIFSVSPTSLDFGDVAIGTSRTLSVTVSNTGTGNLDVASSISGSSEFSVQPANMTILPSGNAAFAVTYTPQTEGSAAADVVFTHNAAGSPDNVSAIGNGIETGLTFTALNIGTTERLRGVTWLSSTRGIVVGNGGVLFLTTDGGTSWSQINLGITNDIYSVRYIGSRVYIIGSGGLICVSDDGGLTWTALNSGTTADFYATSFVNGYYGFAVGSGGTIRLFNGTSWVAQSTGVSTAFNGVYAIGNIAYAVGANGVICRYDGTSWVPQTTNTNIDFYDVAFLNENFGYAVGANGTICKTINGGTTWIPLISGVSVDILSCKVFDPNTAWVTCADGLVLQTTDGGATWTQISLGIAGNLDAIDFLDCLGIAVGENGSAYSFTSTVCTPYSGIYTRLNSGIPWRLYSASFNDALNGCIAGAGGNVLVTSDGGQSWVSSNTGGITNDLTSIRLVGPTAFITGYNGLICRSDNSGVSWTPYVTNTNANFYGSSFLNANYGFAVGSNGTICIYNGTGWTAQPTNTNITFYGVYAVGGTAYAVGENGTICRFNGSVWVPQTTNTNITFYGVAFVNELFGYAVGEGGTICRTRDGGITWEPLVSGVTGDLRSCKIVSPRVAYCLGDDGLVLQTTDCGETWTEVNLEFPLALEEIEIVDGQGFLVGDLGEVFTFSNSTISDFQLFSLSETSIDLGSAATDGSANQIITVTNDGSAVLTIDDISSDNTDFNITPATASINPGESVDFTVEFSPAVTGTSSGEISFTHDASCEIDILAVSGVGVAAGYTSLTTGTFKRLTGISFINALEGCIAGYGGTVLVTSDGGANWTPSNTGTTLDLTGIKLVGNSAFITGPDGLICRSDNAGQSWIPFTTNTSATFYASSFINTSLGWAVGSGGTICVYNGTGWSAQSTGTSITFYGVYAIGGTVYAVGANGTICRFVNGSWIPLTSGTSLTFYDVAFVTEKFGYVVGQDGIICRTRDGGQTWEPLTSGTTVDLRACKVVSPRVAYCAGDDGVILRTTDCGDTWEPVELGSDIDLEGLEIIEGQGFLVGDLGEAFNFSNDIIAEFPLFSLSTDNLDFGDVPVNNTTSLDIIVSNTGNSDLNILTSASDNNAFVVSPEVQSALTVAPNETETFTVSFTPDQTGAFNGEISFTHDGSCETEIVSVVGNGVDDMTPGTISGTVSESGNGVEGIIVKLLDENGDPGVLDANGEVVEDLTTDANGEYEFTDLLPGTYRVMIVEPLGYTADANPKETILPPGGDNIVDFVLSAQQIVNHARSKGYWKHQFDVYVKGRGNAQETEDDLNTFIALVDQHYTPHFPIFAEEMPPGSGNYVTNTSFEYWQDVLTVKGQGSMEERAIQQLAAVLMNLTSLKVSQGEVLTADGFTAGDVLTAISVMILDGDPSNDELAKDLAEDINLQRPIGAGQVGAGNILYKGAGFPAIDWNFEGIPTEFALHTNYPNPFNPSTTIQYDLPEAVNVQLIVYNVLGQKVAELVNQHQEAGRYSINFDASILSSGMYIYLIRAGRFQTAKKMILMK